MGRKIIYECIDAGSDYCPCYLAETNDCITCSHLQGKDFCDCNWRGVCIFQEYMWNGKKAKLARKNFMGKVLDKEVIGDNLIIFKIAVTKSFARDLKQPGSYVFIRDPNKQEYFDIPMSIMYADDNKGEIHIAVQIIGTKTKTLLSVEDEINIRGPYWNGILGLKELKTLKNANTLIVARGAALAPAVNILKYLVRNNNKITLLMDKGKFDNIFIDDYIDESRILTIDMDIMSDKGKLIIQELIRNNNYDLCFSGGSDVQHKDINEFLKELSPHTRYVVTNNRQICCGEGICGSCSIRIGNKTLKACKSQIEPAYMFEKGEI
ncbi:sulfide/dihydroorotate dehydrogenase-like FAD/NAD-binding protein [Paramaledivibacter caminithermalis]|uniref:NAD(P)H-flavin reductase n=1 Tax=Paramaledivibacter caminithermalis (strain DSM 15212 / CIP 107654 / DViRD3) TaxID=1121301 RepID=A0A1M6JNX3_PARC5|nr:sulfide/dihydroorotate dehydrogenase-like FAD/NAD-binding protein [Paramaledivibacter caminithermalis]SHJ48253.1 NAD(P)H-flavin reductase [Paramaledivibacter caminithermalis DSM 15212]